MIAVRTRRTHPAGNISDRGLNGDTARVMQMCTDLAARLRQQNERCVARSPHPGLDRTRVCDC